VFVYFQKNFNVESQPSPSPPRNPKAQWRGCVLLPGACPAGTLSCGVLAARTAEGGNSNVIVNKEHGHMIFVYFPMVQRSTVESQPQPPQSPSRNPKAGWRGRVLLRGTRLLEPSCAGFRRPERLRVALTSRSVATSMLESQLARACAPARHTSAGTLLRGVSAARMTEGDGYMQPPPSTSLLTDTHGHHPHQLPTLRIPTRTNHPWRQRLSHYPN